MVTQIFHHFLYFPFNSYRSSSSKRENTLNSVCFSFRPFLLLFCFMIWFVIYKHEIEISPPPSSSSLSMLPFEAVNVFFFSRFHCYYFIFAIRSSIHFSDAEQKKMEKFANTFQRRDSPTHSIRHHIFSCVYVRYLCRRRPIMGKMK